MTRLFWVVTIIMSWYYSSTLIESSWDGYQHNAISFVVDTTYLDWNIEFPSVTVCEDYNLNLTILATIKYWNNSALRYDINLEEAVRQVSFFSGLTYFVREYCYNLSGEYNMALQCPKSDLKRLADETRAPCEDVFDQCFFRDKEFDCCKYFLPLDTEFGVCFSVNNIHINASYHPERHILDTISNRSTGPGRLRLTFKNNVFKVFFNAKEDVPSFNTPADRMALVKARYPKQVWFSMLEVQNEPEVRDTSVEQRKCRFEDENILAMYDKYGYEPCLIECRKARQLELCGCCNYLIPRVRRSEHCDLRGMLCLSENYLELSVVRNAWSTDLARKGIVCPQCVATCTEMELKVTRKRELNFNSSFPINQFELFLEALPNELPKRIVVRGIMDLVVSMGGAAGLLVGASLLSFVEFIYFFTLRLYGNFKAEEAESTEEQAPIVYPKVYPKMSSRNIGLLAGPKIILDSS